MAVRFKCQILLLNIMEFREINDSGIALQLNHINELSGFYDMLGSVGRMSDDFLAHFLVKANKSDVEVPAQLFNIFNGLAKKGAGRIDNMKERPRESKKRCLVAR